MLHVVINVPAKCSRASHTGVWSMAQPAMASISSNADGSSGNSATRRDGDHKLATGAAAAATGADAAAVLGLGGAGGLWPLPRAFRATLR